MQRQNPATRRFRLTRGGLLMEAHDRRHAQRDPQRDGEGDLLGREALPEQFQKRPNHFAAPERLPHAGCLRRIDSARSSGLSRNSWMKT